MPIRAQSADGTIHEFPDGTPDSVVDKAMHDYANQKPAQQGLGSEIGNYLSGVENGLYAIPQGGIKTLMRGTDALGLTHGAYDAVAKEFADQVSQDKFGSGGKFVGSAIGTLPLMGAGTIAGGALTGATLSDAKDLKGQALDTGIGALGSKVGDLAIRGAASVVSPTISKLAKTLLGEGVRLTPGQILGGTAQRLEDKLTSVPVLGDLVKNARTRGLQDFNNAAINRSLAPIGQSLPDDVTGREAIDYAHTALSDNYNKLLSGALFHADPAFQQNVVTLTGLAQNIPQYGSKPLQDFIATEIGPRLSQNGTMSGAAFKEVDSKLGQEAKDYLGSLNPNDRKLGQAFAQLQSELKDALARANPKIQKELSNTDAGYANLVRIENAAGRQGGAKGVEPGVFTPAQLAAAVRQTDRSVRKNAYARGDALMQDLSDAGNAVLPSQVPDSGTPERALALALGGAGAAGHFISPAAAIPIAGLSGAYTTPGVKLAEALLTKRPANAPQIADALRRNSSAAAIPSAALAAMLMGNQQ